MSLKIDTLLWNDKREESKCLPSRYDVALWNARGNGSIVNNNT